VYSDKQAAALYNLLNPWGPSDDFYLALVMQATSVLDIGCGTGSLLRRAWQARHAGRLCGVDPDAASLDVARRSTEIEWKLCAASSMAWDSEFELATMTGHAFQALLSDDEVRASLTAIHRALVDDGRFAFETRNPQARAWESWNPTNAMDVIDPSGRQVRISHQVESVVDGVVTFTETTSAPGGGVLRAERASLRFLDAGALATILAEAGFEIEAQYGDWERGRLTRESPEIVTIVRASSLRPRSPTTDHRAS